MTSADELNRATWARPETLAEYADLQGWTDVAERRLVVELAPEIRGRAILDVGAGAGRSASFLRLLSDDYVAVDITPEMVELFRRNHPGVDVRVADARDLSMFDDARFGFATFTFNGIDAVDHEGRGRVLRELRRVLAPGGILLLSTHNMHGPGTRHRPWRGKRGTGPLPLRVARIARDLPAHRRRWVNWWHNRVYVDGGTWSSQLSAAHDFTIVMHHTSVQGVLDDLTAAGFDQIELYAREDGRKVSLGDDVSDVLWFQVVARVP